MAKSKIRKIGINEEQATFYFELGMAITHWAVVENTLCSTMLAGLKDKEAKKHLVIAYLSIEGFRSKLAFANNLIEERFSKHSHFKNWKPLFDDLRKFSSHRNQLAHWQVRGYPGNQEGKRWLLIPWISREPKFKSKKIQPPAGSLGVEDIVRIRYQFFNLDMALTKFSYELNPLPEPFPEAFSLKLNPPKIQAIVRQIHEVLGHPREPLPE